MENYFMRGKILKIEGITSLKRGHFCLVGFLIVECLGKDKVTLFCVQNQESWCGQQLCVLKRVAVVYKNSEIRLICLITNLLVL